MADLLHQSHEAHGVEEHEDRVEIRSLTPHFEAHGFPWRQVFGYVASLLLTAMAFGLVIKHVLPATALVAVVLVLALLQAILQLGVFMHLRESRGPAWQILVLGLGFVMAAGLVVASIWIMMFKSGVS